MIAGQPGRPSKRPWADPPLSQQAALPAGAGLTLPPDGEAWSFDRKTTDLLVHARALTRKRGQAFLGYDIFLWGDDTVFSEIEGSRLPCGLGVTRLYDFRLGIAAKLRRWQGLAADGFFDQWGTMAEYVSCHAVALRDLVFHPENAEPAKLEAWAQSLAARRFGPAAAPLVLAAWKEIETAQQIQSDHTYFWHHLRPAWSDPVLQCPIALQALREAKMWHNGRSSLEASKPHGSRDYSPYRDDASAAKAIAPALRRASEHLGKGLVHLQAARPAEFASGHQAAPGGGGEEMVAVHLHGRTERRGEAEGGFALHRHARFTACGRGPCHGHRYKPSVI